MLYSTWNLTINMDGNYTLDHSDINGEREEKKDVLPMVNMGCGWIHYPRGENNKEKYKQILLDACQKVFDDELKHINDLQKKFKAFRGEQCQE